MTNRFFILERDEQFSEDMLLTDDDNNILFEDILELSKEEAADNQSLPFQRFVVEVMDAADKYFSTSGSTLVAVVEENIGIVWCIVIERLEDDKIRYMSVDLSNEEKNIDDHLTNV